MNRLQLQASLKIWRAKHKYWQGRLDKAHGENDSTEIKHAHGLLAAAGKMIIEREKEIAKLTPAVSSKREREVQHALSFIGVSESPNGSNGGGQIDIWERALGFGRVAWCGIFNCNMLRFVGIAAPAAMASVAETENMARSGRGIFRGFTAHWQAALPGDVVLIGRFGQHQGTVVKVLPDGLATVEGNCSNGVRTMHRTPNQIRGIAQIRF